MIGATEEQTLTVTLPVTWTEGGHADVIFTFEFNDEIIEAHHPQENWHSGKHTILLYYPIENVVANYTNTFNVYPTRTKMAVVRNGYLYIPAYDKTGIYKINLSNSADVTKIDFGFTSEMKPLGGSGNCENYLVLIGNLIIGWDFQLTINDTVVQTAGGARLEEICTAVFQYKEYIFFWSSSYLNQYRMTYILTPYLATINNLSQAVVKNADKTMKITYTLTEQE